MSLLSIAVCGAVGGFLSAKGASRPRLTRALLLFVGGALASEAVMFLQYYATYGFRDPKLSVGVAFGVMEWVAIAIFGGIFFVFTADTVRGAS